MRADAQPPVAHGVPQPAPVGRGLPRCPHEPAQRVDDVGGGGVGDVVGVRLHVQQSPLDTPVFEEVGDEEEIGDQLAPGVVGDEAEGAGAVEQCPQPLAVVGDQVGHGVAFLGPAVGEPEPEVGAVAPQRSVQQGRALLLGRPQGEFVQRGQFLVRLRGVEFGELGGPEGVDALPGAGPEVADGVEESAVEVALGPEPGHVEPGLTEMGVDPPLAPRPVRERLDHALGAAVEQGVESAVLSGAVGERLPHLRDDRGMPLGEHAVGEGAGFIGEDDSGAERHTPTVATSHAPLDSCSS
ncbi:hypothetical protein M2156_001994 [Streptomyces sp. SAI-149]|nr:hypothetical protein [Streptomyces sp. SAI-149]